MVALIQNSFSETGRLLYFCSVLNNLASRASTLVRTRGQGATPRGCSSWEGAVCSGWSDQLSLVCAQEVPGHLATRSAQLRASWWLETQGRQSSEGLGIVIPTIITQDLITTDHILHLCVSFHPRSNAKQCCCCPPIGEESRGSESPGSHRDPRSPASRPVVPLMGTSLPGGLLKCTWLGPTPSF